jgi:hypothetical protein
MEIIITIKPGNTRITNEIYCKTSELINPGLGKEY